MLGYIKKIYEMMPKEALGFLRYVPDRFLFGRSYAQWQNKISCDSRVLQHNVYETLKYVQMHTDYGRDHIPSTLTLENSLDLLEQLPCVTSHDLATNLSYYTSDEFNHLNAYTTTTGGTGRNPTTLLLSNELYGIEWAHIHEIWSHLDYKRERDLKLTLRGKTLKGDKLLEYNPLYNELVVDIFKVNASNALTLINQLKAYPIAFIHGYPSLIKQYIEYFKAHNYRPKLQGVFMTSEMATLDDKALVKTYFQCRVVSFYGQSERALLAADFEGDGRYKVYTSYGYPRIVDGELVVTSFVNRALPLVNYAIGDGASLIKENNELFLTHLTSRRGKDFIFLDKDTKVTMTLFGLHSTIHEHILFVQTHQREYGKIEVKLLPKPSSTLNPTDLCTEYQKQLQERLPDFDITICVVKEDQIIKSSRGKMMQLIQELAVVCEVIDLLHLTMA